MVPNPQDRSERSNPEENQTPHSQRTERGSERGEGERLRGVRDERRPNPTKGTRPLTPQRTERSSERGGDDLDELERGTGGQDWVWRLTGRG